jgi:hypothetical protein
MIYLLLYGNVAFYKEDCSVFFCLLRGRHFRNSDIKIRIILLQMAEYSLVIGLSKKERLLAYETEKLRQCYEDNLCSVYLLSPSHYWLYSSKCSPLLFQGGQQELDHVSPYNSSSVEKKVCLSFNSSQVLIFQSICSD